ncbi:Cro/CI family transcriptional regulator [Serratia fonticola]|uniref:Cro/CI family transcriptional regulator n=1 Tax=Serratia fonticola TaxID=47917 RepID=UPI000684F725|nr:Cro/CI family transcriptional regulator [Serratia fonticola]CAI1522177.1 Cro [Serratia fonticola]CAI1789633.1 Cro [Serratia fonticola]CAI1850347.1 Cro [Serratia fonticola]
MKRIPLPDYVSEHGQTKTATDLGMYQSAVSKALKSKRSITVLVFEDGTVKAEENRPFPSNKPPESFCSDHANASQIAS